MADLTGRKVIITGASQGLGAEIARQYVNSGASVVLCSRTQRDLNAVKEEKKDEIVIWLDGENGQPLGVITKKINKKSKGTKRIRQGKKEK